MKAAVCRSFGAPLEIEELRLDPPESREVRIEVGACAICHSDVAYADGAWGGPLPAVFGHEAAGVVREIGPGVSGLRQGDRVVIGLLRSCGRCFFCVRGQLHLCEGTFPADVRPRLYTLAGEPVVQGLRTGTFAEEVVVDESQVAVLPDRLPLDVASLLGCGVVTGVGSVLDKAEVPPGSSVVVIGVGGVGLNVVQGAVLAGADPIVAVDPSPAKRAAATAFGATHAFDPAEADPSDRVRSLTDRRGADYVFVAVGRGDVIGRAVRYVRRGGQVLVLGMPPSDETFGVVAVDLVHDDVGILGSKIGSGSPRFAEIVAGLAQLYDDGRLRLDELISDRFPLARINEAIAGAKSGDALRNVIVFDLEQERVSVPGAGPAGR